MTRSDLPGAAQIALVMLSLVLALDGAVGAPTSALLVERPKGADAAAGADGEKWQDYEADLDNNIRILHERVHRGTYRLSRAAPQGEERHPGAVPG